MGENQPDSRTAALEVRAAQQDDIMPVAAIKRQFAHLHELMSDVLKKDEDYGVIPGTSNKPTLLKPGAEKICTMFRLDPQFEVVRNILEDDFILYDIRCIMWSISTGRRLGSGLGSCNSREEKYNWRKATSKSEFEATSPDRRRLKTRTKRDGTTWDEQQIRTNPYDYLNTLEKMACKRALVAATLITTNASAIFTQDLEDLPRAGTEAAEGGGEGEERKISDGMVKLVHVLCGKLGYKVEKDQHDYCTGVLMGLTGKEVKIDSFSKLSFEDGRKLIDELNALVAKKP